MILTSSPFRLEHAREELQLSVSMTLQHYITLSD